MPSNGPTFILSCFASNVWFSNGKPLRRKRRFPSTASTFPPRCHSISSMDTTSVSSQSINPSQRSSLQRDNLESLHTKVVIVPGKFDSLHVGHRQLAKIAAQFGVPTLMSFSGMSSALGWKPRPPVVANVERDRILRSWSVNIGVPVMWRVIPFDRIQNMSPEQFLQHIVNYFGTTSIVCGTDWRFGKSRKGDVQQLKQLAPRFGLHIEIVSAIDIGGVVSSTRVRSALHSGDVELASSLLGRYHRVVGYTMRVSSLSVICGSFVNMVPACSSYLTLVRVIGRAEPFQATVTVFKEDGETFIRVEDAQRIYCSECEIYIDFISQKV